MGKSEYEIRVPDLENRYRNDEALMEQSHRLFLEATERWLPPFFDDLARKTIKEKERESAADIARDVKKELKRFDYQLSLRTIEGSPYWVHKSKSPNDADLDQKLLERAFRIVTSKFGDILSEEGLIDVVNSKDWSGSVGEPIVYKGELEYSRDMESALINYQDCGKDMFEALGEIRKLERKESDKAVDAIFDSDD